MKNTASDLMDFTGLVGKTDLPYNLTRIIMEVQRKTNPLVKKDASNWGNQKRFHELIDT